MRLLLVLLGVSCCAADTMLLHTNSPPNDPHHTHCQDVKADMSDPKAQAWWSANAWNYPASQGWTKGALCDPDVYPSVEHQGSPIGAHSVMLRRLGKDGAVAPMMVEAPATAEVIRKHQVQQNQCLELVIDMSKNSSECQTYSWWTDHAWHYVDWSNGTCPSPYTHLDRTDHPISVRCIDIDQFGIAIEPLSEAVDHKAYWQQVAGVETPQETTDVMTIHNIAPGGAHCTEIYWAGGTQNACWKEHGYQYPPNLWPAGKCDRTKFNWFNRNGTICEGASTKTWGVHTR